MLADEFERLVERYQPALMRPAYGMAGDRLVAEDAVQGCWHAAWRSCDQIDPARVRGWLFSVTATRSAASCADSAWGTCSSVASGLRRPRSWPTRVTWTLPRHLQHLDLRDRQLIAFAAAWA